MRSYAKLTIFCLLLLPGCEEERRPNFLFYIADDLSPFTSSQDVPAFRQIRQEGVSFTRAFSNAPSCTPARGIVLTGQPLWRLREGGTLFGALPADLPVFPLLLQEDGYVIGHTGKSWGPGSLEAGGWAEGVHPVGTPYQDVKVDPAPSGMSATDYAANFEAFLNARPPDQPFFFWYGSFEPHRRYEFGQGVDAEKEVSEAVVPASMPDHEVIRSDILDYDVEVEYADRHLERMLELLEERGELKNTIVIVTSDHGMPFPRAKATGLYDDATHIPLLVAGPGVQAPGREVTDFVGLIDLAPTLLDYAGASVPDVMLGQSFKRQLESTAAGQIDPARDHIVMALERHTLTRPGDVGYPMRALRTGGYLLVHNYEPDRWPAGDPDYVSVHQGVFGDIDAGPSKTFILEHRDDPEIAPYFDWATAKRPEFELFDLVQDAAQLNNVVNDPRYELVVDSLRTMLDAYLRDTGDPRAFGRSPWDQTPYYFQDLHERFEKAVPDRWRLDEK